MNSEIPITFLPHSTAECKTEFLYIFKKTYASEYKLQVDSIEIREKPFSGNIQVSQVCDIEILNNDDITLFHLIQKEIYYPSINEVIETNEVAQSMFEEEGVYGVKGIKDFGLLQSTVEGIKADELFEHPIYPSILIKAAQLWFSLAKNHCFANGNKRTSLLATIDFLNMNCYNLDYNFDDLHLYEYTKSIIEDNLDIKDIHSWLIDHTVYDLTYVNENVDLSVYNQL